MVGVLIDDPENWVGAIEIVPMNLQMMFVHAYQSWLFNEMLSRRMDAGLPLNAPVEGDIIIPLDANKIPQHENPILTTAKNIDLVTRQVRAGRAFVTITLFGSDGELAEGEMGEIERKVIEENRLKHDDFVIPELSRCTSKGSRREILCPLKTIDYNLNDDGYTLKFNLPKGNYATCLLREFMKSEMRDY
ncbi:MAG: tRNA pseudouridine(13) synthase TruD, partial [Candidatus Methanomethylophilaceae archaeon]|nr:tRNA pseudouridine(13) synthase TruD [Candidatus Methanomethylophilaceae archaeon]